MADCRVCKIAHCDFGLLLIPSSQIASTLPWLWRSLMNLLFGADAAKHWTQMDPSRTSPRRPRAFRFHVLPNDRHATLPKSPILWRSSNSIQASLKHPEIFVDANAKRERERALSRIGKLLRTLTRDVNRINLCRTADRVANF